ncbi:MAG: sulfatase-like hydrolase/transferase [Armatimonadetes bacterium]|nr:sulfatase-like hydrolase/transferase [Armatimonadota bacterium]
MRTGNWLLPSLLTGAVLSAMRVIGGPVAARQRDPGQPNILLIVADDLGYGDLGCTGSPVVETPYLDRLASEGTQATQFYVNAPVCSPSRASLLTGRWPHRYGIEDVLYMHDRRGLPAEEVTLAEVLQQHGYATALIGKWHLGKHNPFLPTRQGFQTFFGLLGGSHDYYTHWRADYYDLWRGESPVHNSLYTTEQLTAAATATIREMADRPEPFFLYLAYNAPHEPLQAPDAYRQRYVGRIPDEKRQTYAAMITCMDESIGQVLYTVEQLGLRSSTLVLFLSDNGGQLRSGASNYPWRGDKGDLLEGGVHVPLLARWPGHIRPGTETEALGCDADLFTTILRAAHAPLPTDRIIDGENFLPALTGRTRRGREEICWRYQHQRAIRAGDWKLVGIAGEPPALYDLPVDRVEGTDLSGIYPEVVRELVGKWESFYGVRWDAGPARPRPASRARPAGPTTPRLRAQRRVPVPRAR